MMGSYNPHTSYKQENAMANAEAMAMLQKMRGEAFGGISDAVENYGQSRARGTIADLMGSGKMDGMTPEQKQAEIQMATGGRRVGEEGTKTIQELLDSTRKTQKNEWDVKADTVQYGRDVSKIGLSHANAMARQAQGNKNALNLAGINNKARQALYGDTKNPVAGQGMSLLDLQHDVKLLNDEFNDDMTTPERKKEIKNELAIKSIRTEQAIKKGGYNQGAGLSMKTSVMGNNNGTKVKPAIERGGKTDKFTKSQRSGWGSDINKITLLPSIMPKVTIVKGVPYLNGKVITQKWAAEQVSKYGL